MVVVVARRMPPLKSNWCCCCLVPCCGIDSITPHLGYAIGEQRKHVVRSVPFEQNRVVGQVGDCQEARKLLDVRHAEARASEPNVRGVNRCARVSH